MYNFSIKVCRVWSEQSSQSCSCCDHIFSGLDWCCLLCLMLWRYYILVLLCMEWPTVIWNYILKLFASNIQLLLDGFWNYTIRSSNGLGRSEGCVASHPWAAEIYFLKNPKHLKAMLDSSLLLGGIQIPCPAFPACIWPGQGHIMSSGEKCFRPEETLRPTCPIFP